jgi:hypothetical protein
MKKTRKALNNYLTVLIDTRLESSFISLGKRGIKEGRRRLRPSSISQAAFLPPYGGGTGWGSLFHHELLPALYIYTLREHGGHKGSRGHRDSSAREVVDGIVVAFKRMGRGRCFDFFYLRWVVIGCVVDQLAVYKACRQSSPVPR